uniref:TTF-type domain-containing protein n=1 Tax=Fagus sylvatica TaxID=28930 RepID=A0A2N9GKG5_FAGSY
MAKSLKGSISKLFNAKIQKSESSSQVEEASGEDMNEVHVELNESVVANEEFSKEEASGEDMDEAHESEDVDVANDEFREEHNEDNLRDGGVNEEASVSMLDLEKDVDVNYDPGLWGIINDTKRMMLVKKGPIKILKENDEFPKEPNRGRHFSSKLYTSNRPNGEKQERKWLVYSNELDKVFCFCCKLFKHNPMTTGLAEDGINDWHNLPTKLRDHEKNPEHNLNVVKWVDLQMRLKQEATIDKQVEALNQQRENSLEVDISSNNWEFDPVMKDHLRRVVDKEVQNHYLSHKIQNELINLSHEEQMSIVIRCVDVEDASEVKVEEFFLGFIKVDDTSGLGLFKRLEDTLVDLKLNIDDIRGQSYDNGANMKGSTHRWDVLKTYVKGLSPKALSVTRWESHIESVRAIRSQPEELRDALIEISNTSKDDVVMAEAKGLCFNALEDFEFLISLCIWYKILDKVNWVSQVLQKEEIELENAIIKIKELILFFEELREDGFLELIEEGKELAKKVGIEPAFTVKRVVRRKKQFDEDVGEDANESQSPQEKFKVTYFYHIIDQALTSLKDRFEQFQRYEEIFGFLLNGKFKSISEDKLMEHCSQLQSFLEYKEHCDIYADELFQELRYLKTLLPKDVTKSIDILNTIKSYWEEGGFQTVWVTYRILLTIPVTVASAERSFSKLKLIKTYLRTTMSQERLSGLAMISIENEYLDKLNYDDLIEDFASKNARRSNFLGV